jgi:two-component system, response regulator YesN
MSSILVVENNDFFRRSFIDILKMYLPNLSIEETADGGEAMQKINSCLPDMVFMDIRLHGTNGLELARKIKGSFPEVVVSILTSYDMPEYRKTAHHFGADHFLPKDDLSGAEVASLIQAELSKKKPANVLRTASN